MTVCISFADNKVSVFASSLRALMMRGRMSAAADSPDETRACCNSLGSAAFKRWMPRLDCSLAASCSMNFGQSLTDRSDIRQGNDCTTWTIPLRTM